MSPVAPAPPPQRRTSASMSPSSKRERGEFGTASAPQTQPRHQATAPTTSPSTKGEQDDKFKLASSIPDQAAKLPLCLAKQVTLRYGDKTELKGVLWLLIIEEFMDFHSRFFDISPSNAPALADKDCEPWVLTHHVLGQTWVHGGHLPDFQAAVNNSGKSYNVNVDAAKPKFVALTDNFHLWKSAYALGRFDLYGNFTPSYWSQQADPNDLIVALPCHIVTTTSQISTGGHSRMCKIFPPLPVSSEVISLMRKIRQACEQPNSCSAQLIPTKKWIKRNLYDHLRSDGLDLAKTKASSNVLDPSSPLYPYRGNEFFFKHQVWTQLCYISPGKTEDVEEVPKAYWQPVIADLQARERIEGAEMLKSVNPKYYDYSGGHGREDVLMAFADANHKWEDTEMLIDG